jgi:hypothetical protein
MRVIRTVIKDIRVRQNLDVYLTMAIAAVVAILNIVGTAQQSVVSSAILATLALVSVSLLANRREADELETHLSKLGNQLRYASLSSAFTEWNENAFVSELQSAKEISGAYVTNLSLLNAHAEEFKAFLARGGAMRVVFVKPRTAAARMACQRGYGADALEDHLRYRLILSLDKLKEIRQSATNPDSVQARFVDFLPATVITLVTRVHPEGDSTAFVTITGFGVNTKSRPSYVLRKETDGKWFDYFKASFENMWKWDQCETIDLDANYDFQ